MLAGRQQRSVDQYLCIFFFPPKRWLGAYQTQSDQELNDNQHTCEAKSSLLAESVIIDLVRQSSVSRRQLPYEDMDGLPAPLAAQTSSPSSC